MKRVTFITDNPTDCSPLAALYGGVLIAHIVTFQPDAGVAQLLVNAHYEPPARALPVYHRERPQLDTATFESSAAAVLAIDLAKDTEATIAQFGSIFTFRHDKDTA